jgi:hypothetical protein
MTLGLGDADARFNVYIANQPDFPPLSELSAVCALADSDISDVGQHCGNGWRKVFNVYAKLVFAMGDNPYTPKQAFTSWQQYRDRELLQAHSSTSLIFSPPQTSELLKQGSEDKRKIHVVMGRTYGKSLKLGEDLSWLDKEFAIDKQKRLIICPYFDYRQLSNCKIIALLELIKSLEAL